MDAHIEEGYVLYSIIGQDTLWDDVLYRNKLPKPFETSILRLYKTIYACLRKNKKSGDVRYLIISGCYLHGRFYPDGTIYVYRINDSDNHIEEIKRNLEVLNEVVDI